METLSLDGMSCGHCVRAVRETLDSLPGVTVHEVTLGQASVSLDASQTTPEAVADALADEGYPVTNRTVAP